MLVSLVALLSGLTIAGIAFYTSVQTAFVRFCSSMMWYFTYIVSMCFSSFTGFMFVFLILSAAIVSSVTIVYDNRASAAEQRIFTAYVKPIYSQILRPIFVWFDSWWESITSWWNFLMSQLPRRFFWDQVVMTPFYCPYVRIGMEEIYDVLPEFGSAIRVLSYMIGNALCATIDDSGAIAAHHISAFAYGVLRGIGDAFACWCAFITYGFDVLANAVADVDVVASMGSQLDAYQTLVAQFFSQFVNVPVSLARVIGDILNIIGDSVLRIDGSMINITEVVENISVPEIAPVPQQHVEEFTWDKDKFIEYDVDFEQQSKMAKRSESRNLKSDLSKTWTDVLGLLRSFLDYRIYIQKQVAAIGFFTRAWQRGGISLAHSIVNGLGLPKHAADRVNATLSIGPSFLQAIVSTIGVVIDFTTSFLRADVVGIKNSTRDILETLSTSCSLIATDLRSLDFFPFINTSEHLCRAAMRTAGAGVDATIQIRSFANARDFGMECVFGELRAFAESLRDDTNVIFSRIPSFRNISKCLLIHGVSGCKTENGTTPQWDAVIGALANYDLAGFLEATTGSQFDNFSASWSSGGMFGNSVGNMLYGPLNVLISAAEHTHGVLSNIFDEADWIRHDNYSDSTSSTIYRLYRAAAASQTDCLFDSLINASDSAADVVSSITDETVFAVDYAVYSALNAIVQTLQKQIPGLSNYISVQWDPTADPILLRLNISMSLVNTFDSILGNQIPRPGDFLCNGTLTCPYNATYGNMTCNDNLYYDKYDCSNFVCDTFVNGTGIITCRPFSNGTVALVSETGHDVECARLTCNGNIVPASAPVRGKIMLKKVVDLGWRYLDLAHVSCTDKALLQTDIDFGALIDQVAMIFSGRKTMLFKSLARVMFEIGRYEARMFEAANASAWNVECGASHYDENLSSYYTDAYAHISDPTPGSPRYRMRRALQCGLTDPADDQRLADTLQDAAQEWATFGDALTRFANSAVHALPLICNNQYESDKLFNFTRLYAESFSAMASAFSVTVQTFTHPKDQSRVLLEAPLLHLQNIFFALAEEMPIIDNFSLPVWGTSTEFAPYVATGAFFHGLLGIGLSANSIAVAALRALMRDPLAPTFLAEDNIYAPADQMFGQIHDRITLMLNAFTTAYAPLQLVDPSLLKMYDHSIRKWADVFQAAALAVMELAIPQRTECACVYPDGRIAEGMPDYSVCAGLEGDVHCATRASRFSRMIATAGSASCGFDEYARTWGRTIGMFISMAGRTSASVRRFAALFITGMQLTDADLAYDASLIKRFTDIDNATYETIARVGAVVGSAGDGIASLLAGEIDTLYQFDSSYQQRGLGDFRNSFTCSIARLPYASRKLVQALSFGVKTPDHHLPYTWELGNLFGSLGTMGSEAITLATGLLNVLLSPNELAKRDTRTNYAFSVSCDSLTPDNTLGKMPSVGAIFDAAEQASINLGNFISWIAQRVPNVVFGQYWEKLGKIVAAWINVLVRFIQLATIGTFSILGQIEPLSSFVDTNLCNPPDDFTTILFKNTCGSVEDLLSCISDLAGLINKVFGSFCHAITNIFHMVFVDQTSPLAKIVKTSVTFLLSVVKFVCSIGSDGWKSALMGMINAFLQVLKAIWSAIRTMLGALVDRVIFNGYMLGSGTRRFTITQCISSFGPCLLSILHLPPWFGRRSTDVYTNNTMGTLNVMRTLAADSFDSASLAMRVLVDHPLRRAHPWDSRVQADLRCSTLMDTVSANIHSELDAHTMLDTPSNVNIFAEASDPESVFAEYIDDTVSYAVAKSSGSTFRRHATYEEMRDFTHCFVMSVDEAQKRYRNYVIDHSADKKTMKQRMDKLTRNERTLYSAFEDHPLPWFNEIALADSSDGAQSARQSNDNSETKRIIDGSITMDEYIKTAVGISSRYIVSAFAGNDVSKTVSDALVGTSQSDDMEILWQLASDLGLRTGDVAVRTILPDNIVTWNGKGSYLRSNLVGGSENWKVRVQTKHTGKSVYYVNDGVTIVQKERAAPNQDVIDLDDPWFTRMRQTLAGLSVDISTAFSANNMAAKSKLLQHPSEQSHRVKPHIENDTMNSAYIFSRASPYHMAFDDAIIAEAVRRKVNDMHLIGQIPSIALLESQARAALLNARKISTIVPNVLHGRTFMDGCYPPGIDYLGQLTQCLGPHDMSPWSKDLPVGMCGSVRDPAPCYDRNPPNDPINLVEFQGQNDDLVDFPITPTSGETTSCPSWYTNCTDQNVQFFPLCPSVDGRCVNSTYFDDRTRWLWYRMCNSICISPAATNTFNAICQVSSTGQFQATSMRYIVWRSSSVQNTQGSTATQNPNVQYALWSIIYSFACTHAGFVYPSVSSTTGIIPTSTDALNGQCGYDAATYPPAVYTYINANAILSIAEKYMFPGLTSASGGTSADQTCNNIAIGDSRTLCAQCVMHITGETAVNATLATIRTNIGSQLINARRLVTGVTPSTYNASAIILSGTVSSGATVTLTLDEAVAQLVMPIVEDWLDAVCNAIDGLCVQQNQSICSNEMLCTGLVVDTTRTLVSVLATPCGGDTTCEETRYTGYCSTLAGIGDTPCTSFDVMQNDPMQYTLDGPSAGLCSLFCQYEIYVPESEWLVAYDSPGLMLSSAPQSCSTQAGLCYTRRFDGIVDTSPYGTCLCPPTWALANDSEILAIHNWYANNTIGALQPYRCSLPITDEPKGNTNTPNLLPFICPLTISDPTWTYFVDIMTLIQEIDLYQTDLVDTPNADGLLPQQTKFCTALCPNDPWCEMLFTNDIVCSSLNPGAVDPSDIAGLNLTQRAQRVLCALFNYNTSTLSRGVFPIASMLSGAQAASASVVSSSGYMQYATACPAPNGAWANALGKWGNTVPYFTTLDNGNLQVVPVNGYVPGRKTVCVMQAPALIGWDRADLPGECRELAVRVTATGEMTMASVSTDNADCPFNLAQQLEDVYTQSNKPVNSRGKPLGATCAASLNKQKKSPMKNGIGKAEPVSLKRIPSPRTKAESVVKPVPKEVDQSNFGFVCDEWGICVLDKSSENNVEEQCPATRDVKRSDSPARDPRYILDKHEILKQNVLNAASKLSKQGSDAERIAELLNLGDSWLKDYYLNVSASLMALSAATHNEPLNSRDIELPQAVPCLGMLYSNRLCLTGSTWGYANFTYNYDIEDLLQIVPARESMCNNPSSQTYLPTCIANQVNNDAWDYLQGSTIAQRAQIQQVLDVNGGECGPTWSVECPPSTPSRMPTRYINRMLGPEGIRSRSLIPVSSIANALGFFVIMGTDVFTYGIGDFVRAVIKYASSSGDEKALKLLVSFTNVMVDWSKVVFSVAKPGLSLPTIPPIFRDAPKNAQPDPVSLSRAVSAVVAEMVDDIEQRSCELDLRFARNRALSRGMSDLPITESNEYERAALHQAQYKEYVHGLDVKSMYSWRKRSAETGEQCMASSMSASIPASTSASSLASLSDLSPHVSSETEPVRRRRDDGFFSSWFGWETKEDKTAISVAKPVAPPQLIKQAESHRITTYGACERVSESRKRVADGRAHKSRSFVGQRGYREDCRLMCQYNWLDLFERSCMNQATQFVANSSSAIETILGLFPRICTEFNIPNDTTWTYTESTRTVDDSSSSTDEEIKGLLGSILRTTTQSDGPLEVFMRADVVPIIAKIVKLITGYPVYGSTVIGSTGVGSATLSDVLVADVSNALKLETGGRDGDGSANVSNIALLWLSEPDRNRTNPITTHELFEILLAWLTTFNVIADNPNTTLGLFYYVSYPFLTDCKRITHGAPIGSFGTHELIPIVGHVSLYSPLWTLGSFALPVEIFKEALRIGDLLFDRDYLFPPAMITADPSCACAADYSIGQAFSAYDRCRPTVHHCAYYGITLPPDILLYVIARTLGNNPFESGTAKVLINIVTFWRADTGFIKDWYNYSSRPRSYRDAVDNCAFSMSMRWFTIGVLLITPLIYLYVFVYEVSMFTLMFVVSALAHLGLFVLTFVFTLPGCFDDPNAARAAADDDDDDDNPPHIVRQRGSVITVADMERNAASIPIIPVVIPSAPPAEAPPAAQTLEAAGQTGFPPLYGEVDNAVLQHRSVVNETPATQTMQDVHVPVEQAPVQARLIDDDADYISSMLESGMRRVTRLFRRIGWHSN